MKSKPMSDRLPKQKERRYFKIKDDISLRMSEDEENTLYGHAAVFNTWADIGGMFRERIAPGAFKRTLKEADVRALYNHDPNYVLGRNKAGTLNLKEDDKGLYFEVALPDTTYAKDLKESVKRGDINQNSFGFMVIKDDWKYRDDGTAERTIQEARLFDVSVVTYPAYEETDVKLRSALEEEGLNYTFLHSILSRSHKQEITDDEKRYIGEMIEKLKSYLGEKEDNIEEREQDTGDSESDKEALNAFLLDLDCQIEKYRR